MDVLLRLRANNRVGSGHFGRCLPLARALRQAGHTVSVALDSGDRGAGAFAKASCRVLPSTTSWDLNQLTAAALERDIVVLDVPGAEPDLVAGLREVAVVIALAVTGSGFVLADGIINPVAREAVDHQQTPTVRPSVRSGARGLLIDADRLRSVVGLLRGSDLLISVGTSRSATSFGHALRHQALRAWPNGAVQLTGSPPPRPAMQIHSSFPQAMAEAGVMICGMGTTLYEAAWLGTPLVAVGLTSAHDQQLRWLKAHAFFEHATSPADAVERAAHLRLDKGLREALSERAANFSQRHSLAGTVLWMEGLVEDRGQERKASNNKPSTRS